jgi:hypothetical protein
MDASLRGGGDEQKKHLYFNGHFLSWIIPFRLPGKAS